MFQCPFCNRNFDKPHIIHQHVETHKILAGAFLQQDQNNQDQHQDQDQDQDQDDDGSDSDSIADVDQ